LTRNASYRTASRGLFATPSKFAGEQAGGVVFLFDLRQFRFLPAAQVLGIKAPGVKATPLWRVNRTGNIAGLAAGHLLVKDGDEQSF
jgi:hypothetical protein